MSSGECNTKTQRYGDTKSGAIKATEKTQPIYETQVLTYLKLMGIKLELLVNFGTRYVKDGVSRIINEILEKDFLVSLNLRVFVFNLVEVLKEV